MIVSEHASLCAHLERPFEFVKGDPEFRARALDTSVPRERIMAQAAFDLLLADTTPLSRLLLYAVLSSREREASRAVFESSALGKT